MAGDGKMVIKSSYFYIGSVRVGYYIVLMALGLLVACAVSLANAKRCGARLRDVLLAGVFAVVGGLFGAKLLFIIVSLPQLAEAGKLTWRTAFGLLNGGTFYGGLLFGGLAVLLYCLLFHRPIGKFFDVYAGGIALGLAVGRIGCLIAGCCYGVETAGGFYVVYLDSPDHPAGDPTHYLPVQLLESLCLVVIFAVCEILLFTAEPRGNSALAFGFLYAAARFVLECFRGDAARGFLLGISTSQYLSVALFLLCYALVLRRAIGKLRALR